MFYFPNLKKALDEYAAYLQFTYKQHVQVKTGALRKSIKVWCVWDDQTYTLCFDMNSYWKWIIEAFPVPTAAKVAGAIQGSGSNVYVDWDYGRPPTLHKGYYDQGRRYPINWDAWQNKLNEAFLEDIKQALSVE